MIDHIVYFIQSDLPNGRVKIGRTRRAKLGIRLRSIQAMSSEPLRLLATLEGPVTIERSLHMRFEVERQHGEWFLPSRRLLEYITQIGAEGGIYHHSKPLISEHISTSGRISVVDFMGLKL